MTDQLKTFVEELESLFSNPDTDFDELDEQIIAWLGQTDKPEIAREVMLAIMDYEYEFGAKIAHAASPWMKHADRSMFTLALKVALEGSDASWWWEGYRDTFPEDRQTIGDSIVQKFELYELIRNSTITECNFTFPEDIVTVSKSVLPTIDHELDAEIDRGLQEVYDKRVVHRVIPIDRLPRSSGDAQEGEG